MIVSEQIIQVIDALCKKFGIAVNWTNENVIPYIQILCDKLIAYEIATSIAWIVFMALLSVVVILITKKLTPVFKAGLEGQAYYECGWTVATEFAIIGLFMLGLAIIIVVSVQVMDIIKCTVFPEMHIFEYVTALIEK